MQLHHRYTVPLPSGGVIEASAIGSDGNIWIAYGNNDNSQVAGAIKVTPQGASTVYPLQPPNGATWVTTLSIVSGPDGALWLSGSASTGAFLFRVTTVGQETAAYPIPAQTTFVSANNALWGLNNDSAHGHLYVVQVSTSGAVTNYLQPESASCPYCEFNVVTGGAGKLWYSGYYGIYAFDFKTHSTSGPITTNLETTRASTAGAFGSDGNLWAAAGPTDLGASTAAVILMHVLTANVKSLSVAAGTSSSFSSTETGSCTSLSATSSNPSVATVTKDSGSCGGASFTVHGIKTGSATVTVTDNDTYYKSNRITIPVTVK